jgi:hypothetical protein
VLDPAAVRAFVEAEAQAAGRTPEQLISTDDNLLLEYSTPRGNVLADATFERMLEHLAPFRATRIPWKNAPPWVALELQALAAIEEGDAAAARAAIEKAREQGATLDHLEAAVARLAGTE